MLDGTTALRTVFGQCCVRLAGRATVTRRSEETRYTSTQRCTMSISGAHIIAWIPPKKALEGPDAPIPLTRAHAQTQRQSDIPSWRRAHARERARKRSRAHTCARKRTHTNVRLEPGVEVQVQQGAVADVRRRAYLCVCVCVCVCSRARARSSGRSVWCVTVHVRCLGLTPNVCIMHPACVI